MNSKVPTCEKARLSALQELNILGSSPEKEFDDLALIASQIRDAPISAVSFVVDDYQWFKAKVGIEASARQETFHFVLIRFK